ncbi:MAG: hypothetical protein ACKPCM_08870 [Pseudanabaena sp.]
MRTAINAASYETDEDYEDTEDAKAALTFIESEVTLSWESLKSLAESCIPAKHHQP